MTTFDREMHNALREDAQKLRDQGVDVADPMFIDADEKTCIYCGCTEDSACIVSANATCGWLEDFPPVCDAPECVAKNEAAMASDVDLANPPIVDVEDTGKVIDLMEALKTSLAGEAAAAKRGYPHDAPEYILEIPLDAIAPDPAQARDEGADDSIGDTLKPTDVLPAIELRVHPNSENPFAPNARPPFWMIIDGERRWRGSKKAGRTTIRAWVNPNPGDDGDRLLRQAVLNEGERLKPMEEARTWKRIKDAKGWNIQQLAEAVGRAKSTVSDRLAMLDAPAPFQPLFADGTLSAAAAPVIRPYAHLSDAIITKILERAVDTHAWMVAARDGKTVPLKAVEEGLASALSWPFNEMHKEHVGDYAGEKFEVKGKHYAVDNDAYWKHVRTKQAAAQKKSGATTPSKSNDDWQKQQAEANKRAAAKRDREDAVRAAQIGAVKAKLPSELTGPWLLAMIDYTLTIVDTYNVAEFIELPKPGKKTAKGVNTEKQILAHAEKLDAKGRANLLLKIMLADALEQYGNRDFLDAAAKVLKIDLKKIKPPADEKAKKAKKALAKPVSKKRR